ncbi:unnamed protein product [Sphagnum jensenii]
MAAFSRLLQEAKQYGGRGVAGVSFEIMNHGGNLEFLAMGSTIHGDIENEPLQFTTSADVQQLYCQEDAGFKPISFVFGNVAYSIGLGGSILGSFSRLTRGEIPEYSEIFDQTRHLALARITQEAKNHGANAVIGIQTTISPLLGTQEMMMMGTASTHEALQAYSNEPVTSSLTNEEMWNLANLGYLPIKLVMGVSVYSLGLKGGILASLKSIGGGEIKGLTELLYEAREKALARIERDAELCGSDAVVNVQTRVYDLGGGMIEFMAIGTAVKKIAGVTTKNPQLPPQAIIQNQEMFVDSTQAGGIGLGLPFLIKRVPWSFEAYLDEKLSNFSSQFERCDLSSKPKSKAALEKLVGRIFPVSETDRRIPLSVQLIHGNTVNAFASVNGKVYVFEGLLKEAQSAEELAGVLSHEIEHVKRRHVLEGVASGAISFLWMPDLGSGSALANRLLKLKFSRTQEEEADEGGLNRLKEARVSALGFKSFFERMEVQTQIPAMLSDHPSSDLRAKMTELYLNYPSTEILTPQEWANLKQSCSTLIPK